jgi:hypothetical protein
MPRRTRIKTGVTYSVDAGGWKDEKARVATFTGHTVELGDRRLLYKFKDARGCCGYAKANEVHALREITTTKP